MAGLAGLALAACSAPERPDGAAPSRETPVPAEAPAPPAAPSLFGRWTIEAVNGAPARPLQGAERPYVTFSPRSYGGSSGCNHFGGNGLWVGDRWFAEAPMATAMGCGALTAQEDAVFKVLSGGPVVTWEGEDVALLTAATGTMRLRRDAAPAPPSEAEASPMRLAGTRWDLHAVDGKGIDLPGQTRPARLTFEADQWTLATPCASVSGRWRQEAGAVALEPGSRADRACGSALTAPSEALIGAVAGRLAYTVGLNGELVLAGGDHWIVGRRDVTLGWEQPNLLSGRWRIVSVDGTPPPPAERPAELAFGPGAFALWDGCRHSEGVAIAHERRLFVLGSGVVTLANCPADPVRAEIAAALGGGPRIALTGAGGVALVSDAGTLRLERVSTQPFGTGVETRLRAGSAFDLLTGEGAPARLTLAAGGRFTLALPCGTIAGRWRTDSAPAGPYARFSPDAGCSRTGPPDPIAEFFTGDVLAAIGPNRDIALFVSRDRSLAARPVR
ncbi:META domain-containing protein [Sphingomonas parva]|uniref:META domain-containing protein n=1 Tax=Sphingomonas parva TaxID=2555898 RepID=A0A4Y8ZQ37_9SPHN|nr:META domain-containing protein [Sphingomonas parva]TFI56949.1 META domain-containing protein [Sphingomonas parva]